MILVKETDDRFYIKESSIPNSGLGVFTKIPLKKGDWLEIIGVQVESQSTTDTCSHYADKYKFAANGKMNKKGERTVDFSRKIVPLGYGGMVNHAPKKEQQNAEIFYRNGQKRNQAAGKAVYRFIRDIEADEEILGNYGEEWMVIMDWASTKANDISNIEDEWKTFLGYDIYNLGSLEQDLKY